MDRPPFWTLLLAFLAACGPAEPAQAPPGQLPAGLVEGSEQALARGDRTLLEPLLERIEEHLAAGGAQNPAQALAGRAAEGLLDPSRALEHYRQADLAQDRLLSVRRGSLELDVGELQAAAADLERAQALGLDNADLHYQFGRLAEERGDLTAARDAYVRSLERAPARPAVHFSMSRVLDELGNEAGAEQAMAEFMRWTGVQRTASTATDQARARPQDSTLALGAAQAWYAAGEFERSAGWARHALDLQADLHAAHSLLGWAHLALGEQQLASMAMTRAVEVAPGSAEAQYQLGLLRLELGDSQAALRAFDSALVLQESLVDAHLGAAQVCYGLGRFPEARAHWQRTLELVPGHAGALQSLAVLDRDKK